MASKPIYLRFYICAFHQNVRKSKSKLTFIIHKRSESWRQGWKWAKM